VRIRCLSFCLRASRFLQGMSFVLCFICDFVYEEGERSVHSLWPSVEDAAMNQILRECGISSHPISLPQPDAGLWKELPYTLRHLKKFASRILNPVDDMAQHHISSRPRELQCIPLDVSPYFKAAAWKKLRCIPALFTDLQLINLRPFGECTSRPISKWISELKCIVSWPSKPR